MQQHAEAVGDALHHGGGVGQTMEGGSHLDQNAGAAMLFAGELVQAEGFECGAELCGQDRDFAKRIIVEAGMGVAPEEGDGSDHFSGNVHRSGQSGVRMGGGEPGKTG